MAKNTYEIQDKSGNWSPYTGGGGTGNIRSSDGTTYSNYAGDQAYLSDVNTPDPTQTPAPGAGDIPTNPDGSQVGGGTPWDSGSSAPNSAPPGYHWDPDMAMFQPDEQTQVANPYPSDGSPNAGSPPVDAGAGTSTPVNNPQQPATPPPVAPPAVPSGGSQPAPPASPGSAAPPDTGQSAFGKSIRDALMKALNQPNVTADDPEIAPAIAANRVSSERALQQQRDAIAERLNAQGMGGSGALDQQMSQAFEQSGAAQGMFAGNAVLQQATARRQQLVSLLSTGAGIMNADDAQALQGKIADIDEFLRQQSITNQNNQFNDSMGLSAAQFLALLNHQTVLGVS